MLSSAKQNIALETIELFLEILKLDEIAALSNKALGDLLINIAMSSEKLEAGVLNSTDHSLVLLAYEIANNNFINALNNLKDKISLYEESVGGFPPLSRMKYSDIEKDQMPQSREGALKLAIQNHPVIFACKEHIKEAKAQYKGSFSKDHPEVEFELSADWQKNMKNTEKRERVLSAMVNVTYNLFGNNNNIHYNKKYKSQVSQAEALCDVKEREVKASIKLSYAAYKALSQAQKYIEEAKKKTTFIANSYKERVEVETISFEKLIHRNNQKLEAEIKEIENRYDLILAKYRVLHGMGLLLQHFDMSQHTSQREI
jgi:adhesin transport system outer membrane protein